MMELIEQRYGRINIILVVLILAVFNSCHENVQLGALECLLENIENTENKVDILVGQHNGWSDTTALIIVTYHKKSMNIPISSELKGTYNGHDIFFYQTIIDSLDKKKYKQIPNNIIWVNNSLEIKNETFSPPYDPMSVQVEYNIRTNCIGDVVKGEGYLTNNFRSKCGCEH